MPETSPKPPEDDPLKDLSGDHFYPEDEDDDEDLDLTPFPDPVLDLGAEVVEIDREDDA